jgi:hypothetical protein
MQFVLTKTACVINIWFASWYKLSFMKLLFKPAALFCFFTGPLLLMAFTTTSKKTVPTPKIQAAILLDVSNSMDGLIEQAKAQLWNMVSTMGKAQCNGASPKIEIALYEYGRSSNDVKQGYVKRINSFISDLDSLSQNLFSLTTNGGDEFCGHVIYSSLNELQWDAAPENYKVIFIAGNEDFLQGDIQYIKACNEAKQKGVIVNTIYCGDKMQGIKEHWNLNAECGSGSYTNINQDAKMEEIPTPYDSTLYVLNGKLNGTYIAYGSSGMNNYAKQGFMDVANTSASKTAGLKRIAVKGNGQVYKNSGWDLVDKNADGELDKVDVKQLPDSLQKKSKEELKVIVENKSKERAAIQQQITTTNAQREAFINAEKLKRANNKNEQTLETEVEKIIKSQAKRYNMVIQ